MAIVKIFIITTQNYRELKLRGYIQIPYTIVAIPVPSCERSDHSQMQVLKINKLLIGRLNKLRKGYRTELSAKD